MSRPKGSKNKVKKIKKIDHQPIEKIEKRGRPKGSNNTLKKVSVFSPSYYIPYEKNKKNKDGKLITYQTYKKDGVWLIDIFTNRNLTLKGFDAGITKLGDAIQFIDSEIARL